ncbi:unnamed protein product [Cercospora beticola]|nr:unnamed protein product [Cercospora beticola]
MRLITLLAVVLSVAVAPATTASINDITERAPSTCGLRGTDGRTRKFLSQSRCSFSQCVANCRKSSKCQAYGYGENQCRLYSATCSSFVRRDSRSPYAFYDRTCRNPSPPTTTTKTTARTTSKTTTTTSRRGAVSTTGSSRGATTTTTTSSRTTTTTSRPTTSTTTATSSTSRSTTTTTTSPAADPTLKSFTLQAFGVGNALNGASAALSGDQLKFSENNAANWQSRECTTQQSVRPETTD